MDIFKEYEDTEKYRGILSTSIVGFFLTIAIAITVYSLTLNLKEFVDAFIKNAESAISESQEENGFQYFFISGTLSILVIFYYLTVFIPFIIVHCCLISITLNVRLTNYKAIRIINFIYLGLAGTIVTINTVKFILFASGVA